MENGRIQGLGWESCVLLLPLVTTGSHDCALPAAAISSSFPWGLSLDLTGSSPSHLLILGSDFIVPLLSLRKVYKSRRRRNHKSEMKSQIKSQIIDSTAQNFIKCSIP